MIKLHFNGTTLEVHESDSSYRYRSLMAKPQLVLKFSLPEYVEIPVGAWCEFMGTVYTLPSPQNIKKNGKRKIDYTLIMVDDEEKLGNFKFRNPVDGRLKWSMCAKPKEFLEAIVSCLNKRDGGWSLGSYIDSTEKTIEFNHVYLDEALADVASTFETEYEVNGKVISLGKVEYFKDNPLHLSYGKGNGFMPGVGRSALSDEKPIKLLYVQGGEKNIDRSKYGSPTLLLPKSQSLEYEGRTYSTDAEGLYIQRTDKVSDAVKDDSLDCSEIYPSRVGTVSSVEVVDAERNFYDFTDNSIPDELDFNDYIIEGETPVIRFQSGMLAGEKDFEFKYIHTDEEGNAVRRFELVPQEIDGQTMPNDTFIPEVGNTYAIFGIMLPDSYICNDKDKSGASWDMFREGVKFLYEHEEQKFTFNGELQALWAKRHWENVGGKLVVGGYVLFTDEQFAKDGVLIRITGIKEYLTSPYSPTIEISNSVAGKSFHTSMRDIENTEIKIDNTTKSIIQFTKRRFRDAQETMLMLEDAMLNFSGSINPITVQTMAALVGDESLQFRFVESKNSLKQVAHNITYDIEAKQLHCPAGFLQHMTIGIKSIASEHKASEYKTWEMNAFVSGVLNEPKKKYYLYAKVSSTSTDVMGDFLLSETAIEMNAVSGYYHLLTGILNSEYEGERSFVTLYGFTEILPGRITTDKIVSTDGKTYFDLSLGEIGGNIKIKAGSSGMKNFEEFEELSNQISALDKALDETDGAIDDLEDYIDGAFADGIITEAEAKAIEKYINTVNNTKAGVEATYNKLYANSYLSGTAKTGLLNAKITLFGAIDDLLSAINTAIADGATTVAEKNDVDSKFTAFNTALSSFNTAVETANKAIQDALKSSADSQFEVLSNQISAQVTRIDTINNTIESAGWITKADGNTWWASKTLEDGNTLISYINQTATTTTINSSKINLTGKVTYSMLNSALQGILDGKADSSSLGSLALKSSVDWNSLSATLQSTLDSYAVLDDLGSLASLDSISWNNLATTLKNTINDKLVSSDLGSLAFLDSVSSSELAASLKNVINAKVDSSDLGDLAGKDTVTMQDLATALQNVINSKIEASYLDNDIITFSRLGNTIVEGGYIKTSLLNVIKIAAVEGTIAGLNISNNSITSIDGAYDGGTNASKLSNTSFHLYAQGNSNAYMGYSGDYVRAELGLNTYNGTSSQKIMCDLRDTESKSYAYTKIGLYLDICNTYDAEELAYNSSVTSNVGATAIYINRGHVTGLKRRLRHISGNSTAYLNKDDSIVNFHNTSEITAYLPTECEDGQEIWVFPWNTKVTVKTQGGATFYGGGSDSSHSCEGKQYHIFIYCAYNSRWVVGWLRI